MEDKATIIESLVEKAEAYGKTSLHLFKLKAVDKSADMASSVIADAVVLIVFIVFIILFSIGGALWLGELLGKTWYGFFIVAGFYGMLALVFQIFKKALIKTPINNSIIFNFLK